MDLGKKLRDKAKLELLKQEINKIAKKTGISSESKLALIQPKRFQVSYLHNTSLLINETIKKYLERNKRS